MFACDADDVENGGGGMIRCDVTTATATAGSDVASHNVCCPAGSQCSKWGCVVNASHTSVFVSSSELLWANAVVQLLILFAGVVAFGVGTMYYWLRRRHQAQRIQRSRLMHQVVNEDERASKATASNNNTASTTATSSLPCWASAASFVVHDAFAAAVSSPSPPAATPALKQLSKLDGQCCGCGATADTVLLPCLHAVCCYTCSAHASYCPFCKAACSGRMRLYPV